MPTDYSDSPEIRLRTSGTIRADSGATKRPLARNKPSEPGRRCECGKKISIHNPNDTCWEHTPLKYPRVRGVLSDD